ncbi:NAD(P)/FAD-dependent oxidoreductase [Aquibacillus rhizosphaerae]|uniref:Ferredoxin--NADP reductase n=1 Tax=Aquibacillus rhizosphaerae TaxID=3051431 RepID=A0ABT7L9C3_9BACI|nr:NAD(P)/FAD-dependent oxidoreductase [Aquibacillus sp. LR5S19]MDL4841176.1 NAD(P)/FAD-dependent oxidoreductase [Aquibacillus sp. LR5S19]
MEETKDIFDVTIIGGGTTGMFVSFYSGMRDMKTKLIESNQQLGGKVAQFFPEKLIYDVGGIPEISGDHLVDQMQEQSTKHHPTVLTGTLIEEIVKDEDNLFILTSSQGKKHYSKSVIVTTGMGSFDVIGPVVENADLYEQTSWHYSLRRSEKFKGKKVMITSNNRVGVDWALTLESVADTVYLINDGAKFQHASENELARLASSSIQTKTTSEIIQVNGKNGYINEVTIRNKGGLNESIVVDDMLVYNGIKLNQTPFEKWGLKTEKGRVVVTSTMETDVEGLFVAGDATIYPGKTMLIASGYTEGIAAVNSAKTYIDPKASATVYSSIIYRKEK